MMSLWLLGADFAGQRLGPAPKNLILSGCPVLQSARFSCKAQRNLLRNSAFSIFPTGLRGISSRISKCSGSLYTARSLPFRKPMI